MSENNLTEEQKRKLTEDFLGEKWHRITENPEWKAKWNTQEELPDEYICHCGMAVDKYMFYKHQNRAFTTPNDMMALKERMVDKNLWDEFLRLSFCQCIDDEDPCLNPETKEVFYDTAFIDWLMNPPRFCRLVAKWLEKEA